jgi:hypothetical protein
MQKMLLLLLLPPPPLLLVLLCLWSRSLWWSQSPRRRSLVAVERTFKGEYSSKEDKSSRGHYIAALSS